MTGRARLRWAIAAGACGLALFVGSVLWRWRYIVEDRGYRGSPSRNYDAVFPLIAPYLVGMLALLVLAEAALLAGGRAQWRLRLAGTAAGAALLAALGVFAAVLTESLSSQFSPDPAARAHAYPGPSFALAAAAVLACVTAIWLAPRRGGTVPRSYAGWLLLAIGLGLLATSLYLPLLRSYYPDMTQVDSSEGLVVVALPNALIGAGLTAATLLSTGDPRRLLRSLCVGWTIITAIFCGGLSGLLWLAQAGDALAREHGQRAATPGEGLLLALLACVLIPLAGALARARALHSPDA